MHNGDTADFLARINQLHSELDVIWPHGRDPVCSKNDGPHYTLRGYKRPVSIGRVEAYLLYNVVRLFSAHRGCEIGTGFGYSSFWIGAGIRSLGRGGFFGSVDDLSEGMLGDRGTVFARRWAEKLELSEINDYYAGRSPEVLATLSLDELDFIMIDGNHNGDQPMADYKGLKPYLCSDSLLIWHDVQSKYSVNHAVAESMKDGWSVVTFPTSCRLAISYCTMRGWNSAIEAYDMAKNLQLA